MKKLLPLVFLSLLANIVAAQDLLDNNPTFLRWNQINTQNFRIVFPRGFEEQAQRMANTMEQIHDPESKTLGSKPRKISLILQNQSAVSNGFVSILPRRSEFYAMPPQDYNFIGTNDWLNLLATHEYRHVVQYQHATRGFNRFIYYLFGNTTLAGFSQAAVPQWFWEGDAVATETAFTRSGRGRIPNFGLVFKTNLLEGRKFNYHKQYLRSYKHNIPNHYVLGYYMVNHLRKTSGDPEIWGKITGRAWSLPFIPFTFSNSIHRETGSYVTKLYNAMADDLKKKWQAEIDQLSPTSFTKITKRTTSAYTDYSYPQPLGNDNILVLKRGIADIDQFVMIDKNGGERKVFVPGFINDAGMVSSSSNKVVWSEYGYDPRWAVRNYSLIKVYDITTKQKKIIGGRRGRLSGAALSPDGRTVVAVNVSDDYKASVQLFDVFLGKKIKDFPNPENAFYSMPRWSHDGQKIVVIKTEKNGKYLTLLDPSTMTSRDLYFSGYENIGHPVLSNDFVLFNSPVTGIDNIFAINFKTGGRYRITSSKYAAYNPAVSPDGKLIYYNEQTRDGLDVVEIPFAPETWKVFEVREPQPTEDFQHLVQQEGRPALLDSISTEQHPVTKYSKLKGILNPYSWGAFLTNDLAQINAGIASRDILSTTSISAGYLYDINEGTSSWRAGVSYQGLYPIVDFDIRTGNRENNEQFGRYDAEFKWKELTAEGGLRIPLQLTSSKYSRQVSIGNAIGFTRTTEFKNTTRRNGALVYEGPGRYVPAFDTLAYIYKDQLNNGDLIYNHFTFSFSNLLKRSRRDFLSPWGQTLNVELYNTPYGGDFKAKLFALRSTVYFPGFFKHHFLYGRFAYQESFQGIETNTYLFRNTIAKPRGHSYPSDETFYSMSANYALPLWYPDIAVGPVFNLQRIKANFFYDYGKGTGNIFYYKPTSTTAYVSSTNDVYQSIGVETTFDFNLLRFLPKFEIGLRSTYLFANQGVNSGMKFEIVIGNIGF